MPTYLSRRRFLQLSALSGASLYLGFPRFPAWAAGPGGSLDSPIFDLRGAFASVDFNGDDVRRPHQLLWDVEGYVRSKGGRPGTFRREKLVVVGGGMAGLLSAHFLRKHKPVLLEQAQQFGGNSKGESYQGATYSLGAAYITVPEEGSSIDKFIKEIGLSGKFRHETEEETRVLFGGVKSLWRGETDPAALGSAKRIGDALKKVYDESYPEIPWSEGDPLTFAELKALDRLTGKEWLRQADPKIHPHVEEYFQLYCWSSFGGSLEEISAAQFLNFVAAEIPGVWAFAGGNSAIARALHESLRAALPAENIASDSIVLEVKNSAQGVEVLYEDSSGALRLIHAEAAIMAAPKYVARAIIKGGGAELEALWKTVDYRAYVVVNVLLKEKVNSPAFDLFCLKGEVPSPPKFSGKKRPWSDLIFADWANHDESDRSLLTLYRPLPYDGAKNTIMDSVAHDRIRAEVAQDLPAQLRDLGIPADAVEGVRITRWGHALPLAEKGAIHSGKIERLSAPIGRIFFANQDNYLNPAFESSFAAAERAAESVGEILNG